MLLMTNFMSKNVHKIPDLRDFFRNLHLVAIKLISGSFEKLITNATTMNIKQFPGADDLGFFSSPKCLL